MEGERINNVPESNEAFSVGLERVVRLCRDGNIFEAQRMYTQIKSAQLAQDGESQYIYPFLVYSQYIEIDTLDQAIAICEEYEYDLDPCLVAFYVAFSDWIGEQVDSIGMILQDYDATEIISNEEYSLYCDCLFRQVYYMGIDLFVLRNTRCTVAYLECLQKIYNNHGDFLRMGASLFFMKYPLFFTAPDDPYDFFRGNCIARSNGRRKESSLNEDIREHVQEVFFHFFRHHDFEILFRSDTVMDFFAQMQNDAEQNEDEIFTVDAGVMSDASRKIADEQYFLDQLPIGAYDIYQFFRQEMEQKYGTILCGATISAIGFSQSDDECSKELTALIDPGSELALLSGIEQIIYAHHHRTFDVGPFLTLHDYFSGLSEGYKVIAFIFLIAYQPMIGIQFLQKYPTLLEDSECMNSLLAYLLVDSSREYYRVMQEVGSIFPYHSGIHSYSDLESLASSMKKTLIQSDEPHEKILGYSIGYYISVLFPTEYSNPDYCLEMLGDNGVDEMDIARLEFQKEGHNSDGLSVERVAALFSKSLDPHTLKPDRYVLEQCIRHSMKRSDFSEAMRYYRIGVDMGVDVREHGVQTALESHNFSMLAQMLRDMTENFSKNENLSATLRAYLTKRMGMMILGSTLNNEDQWYLTGLIILLGQKQSGESSEEIILFKHIGLLDRLVKEKSARLHDQIHDLYIADTYENGMMLSIEALLQGYLYFLYTHFLMRKKQFSSVGQHKSYIEQMVKLLAQYPDTQEYIREWFSILLSIDVPEGQSIHSTSELLH